MEQYLSLVHETYKHGNLRGNRTDTRAKSMFGGFMKFDLTTEFPLLTTKFTPFRSVVSELLWFIVGSTNIGLLQYIHGGTTTIWDEWATPKDVTRNDARSITEMIAELSVKTGMSDSRINQELVEWETKYGFPEGISKYFQKHDIEVKRLKLLAPKGEIGQLYGFQWRKRHSEAYRDQLGDLLTRIEDNPHDRRLLLVSWDPDHLPDSKYTPHENVLMGKMAIAPCHWASQFYVDDSAEDDRKLDCMLHMRSSDMFLGLPFNIASYALLTHLMARELGVSPGNLPVTLGDHHIYENHFKQTEEMLSRESPPLPTFKLTDDVPSLRDIMRMEHSPDKLRDTVDKIVACLIGYEHAGKLSGKVAI